MKKIWAGLAMALATLVPIGEAAWYGPAADAQAQVELIAECRERWEPEECFMMSSLGFTITDLDHNGRLEILVSDFGGTGLYTYTSAYEVNEDRTDLTQCLKNWSEERSEGDWMGAVEVNAYTNGIDGIDWYVIPDYLRAGRESTLSIAAVSLQEGVLYEKPIALADTMFDDEGNEHTSYQNGDGATVSEEEFNRAEETVFAGSQRARVPFNWIVYYGDEYNQWRILGAPTIAAMLYETYETFIGADIVRE